MKEKSHFLACIAIPLFVYGCTAIPSESVTLSKEISKELSEMHQMNTAMVGAYFDVRRAQIYSLEEQAINDFIEKLSAHLVRPGAQQFGPDDLDKIRREIDKIHSISDSKKEALIEVEEAIKEKLQVRFDEVIAASQAMTRLLDSYRASNPIDDFQFLDSLAVGESADGAAHLVNQLLGETKLMPTDTSGQLNQ